MHSSNRLTNTAFDSYLRHGLIQPSAPTALDLKQARTITRTLSRDIASAKVCNFY